VSREDTVTPEIPKDLMQWLEASFPPLCFTGNSQEQLMAHVRYSGMVELVARLRGLFDQQEEERQEDQRIMDGLDDPDHSVELDMRKV
jgi:hypothetical protein